MHETIIKGDGGLTWSDWLDSVPGRYLLGWEKQQFDALVGDVFGYYAVQVGLPEIDMLQANRMPSRIQAVTRWLDAPGWPGYQPPPAPAPADGLAVSGEISPAGPAAASSGPAAVPVTAAATSPSSSAPTPSFTHRIVVESFEHLPFAEQSVDLIVLPHVLELASDPHQVLREVDRVLRPEGRVVLSGLNPISLWGARHLLPRLGRRPALPPHARFIGLPRLRDWFKLLSFDVEQHHYGCYRPPCQSQIWLDRMHFVERAGDRWWPICGAVYCVSAVKRVQAIRLIPPVWRSKEKTRRRVAVATSANRQRQTVE